MITRPMLAASAKTEEEIYKVFPKQALISPKLDGIRCLIHPELGPVTRTFKPIPNKYIHEALRDFTYFDGEIVTYQGTRDDDFNTVQSKVMTRTGTPTFNYLVFDYFQHTSMPFIERYNMLRRKSGFYGNSVNVLGHELINSPGEFLLRAEKYLANFEGAMYRDVNGEYKSGRSTLNQGWLVKWKNVQDAEGIIIGFVEQVKNTNKAKVNVLGLTERSSEKANLESKGTLGALRLHTEWGELRIGSGFDEVTRRLIWNNQEQYMGKIVTFKYQPFGAKDLPRFPIFKGFRKD